MNRRELARYLDHTDLRPEATPADIQRLCEEGVQYGFAGVCVNGCNVAKTAAYLQAANCTTTKVVAVIGFPLGAVTTATKVFEARDAMNHGADEIDMVVNIGDIKSGHWLLVRGEIAAVVNAAAPIPVKVILETGKLTEPEIIKACIAAKEAGAAFVKTSTGFARDSDGKVMGATVEHVRLMRKTVGPKMGVKASGGVRTREEAEAMIEAGATRIGASASVQIVLGAPEF
jgi:deoxyribose-phosphate aldolase